MFAYQHGHVTLIPRAHQLEQSDQPLVNSLDGIGVLIDERPEEDRSDGDVLLEQRKQKVILALEVPVEALERLAGAGHDLLDGEGRAARLLGEGSCRRDELREPSHRSSPGVRQRPVERPDLPRGRPFDGRASRDLFLGERHSPECDTAGRPGQWFVPADLGSYEEAAMIPVRRLNHAVLYIRDVDRSVAFYRDAFGFEVVEQLPGQAAFLRAADSDNHHDLGLFALAPTPPGPEAGRVGLYHLAWEVGHIEDLADAAETLRGLGALVGASDHGATKSLYGKTPTATSSRSCGWCRATSGVTTRTRHRPSRSISTVSWRGSAAERFDATTYDRSTMSETAEEIPAIPAATVVLLRDGADGVETLMLRRNSKLAFAGGMWVWPGGRIDPDDYDAEDPEDVLKAATRAAVRETSEEAGLVIDDADLVWFSHWTPPSISPKRFATWFFAAPAPDGVVSIDGGEIHDHQWIAPRTAMELRNKGEIELGPPTWITLEQLKDFSSASLAMAALDEQQPEYFSHALRRSRRRRCRPVSRRRGLRDERR